MARQPSSVRERLWLLAHDEYNDMRPRINVRVLDIGLAAAALVDLLLWDRITVDGGLIHWNADNRGTVGDPIARDMLRVIAAGPAPRLAEVLHEARAELLGGAPSPFQDLYQHTRAVLVAGGYLAEQRRRLWGTRYTLADSTLIFSIRGQLNYVLALHPRRSASLANDCLIALVWALELHSRLPMPYSTSEAEPILSAITGDIPRHAGEGSPVTVVPHLVQLVRHAVGDLATAAF
jgi:hypothetical protein